MRNIIAIGATLALFYSQGGKAPQSLAEVARNEAERRKALEQQGVKEKIVEADDSLLVSGGNLTVFSGGNISRSADDPGQPPKKLSVQPMRTKLQQLDRDIRRHDEQLISLGSRLAAARWALPKTGRALGKSQDDSASQERLQRQIHALEAKLKHLRQERQQIYDAGRKAGYLPGELEGRGIVP